MKFSLFGSTDIIFDWGYINEKYFEEEPILEPQSIINEFDLYFL